MKRTQFTFYDSFYESIQALPQYKQLEAYNNLIRYALYEEKPKKLEGLLRVAFVMQKPILDTARRKAIAGAKGGKANGKQHREEPEDEELYEQE